MQVRKLLSRRQNKRCCGDVVVGARVRVRIMRKAGIEKRTLPEYTAETHRVTRVRQSQYNYEEFQLSNGKIYRRDRILVIPEDTRQSRASAPEPVRVHAPTSHLPLPPRTRSGRQVLSPIPYRIDLG